MKSDKEFFAHCAEQERAAARRSSDDRMRKTHLERANAYDDLSRALDEAQRPTLKPVT